MSLAEITSITERLDELINQIPKTQTCELSEVPNGMLWCNYYNQTMAGRCPSCPNYKLGGNTE